MADITEAPVVDTTADIIETHPLVDNDDLHAGVAERLRHSKEFGSALWDATKDYLQKMNLTAEERAIRWAIGCTRKKTSSRARWWSSSTSCTKLTTTSSEVAAGFSAHPPLQTGC